MLRQEATALMEWLKVSVAGHVLLTTFHPDTIEATIFVYNGFEGGIGISEPL